MRTPGDSRDKLLKKMKRIWRDGRRKDMPPPHKKTVAEEKAWREIKKLILKGGKFLGNIWTNNGTGGCFEVMIRYRRKTLVFKSSVPFPRVFDPNNRSIHD